MNGKSLRETRDRRLTPDEAARYDAIRQSVENEKPEIVDRLKDEGAGPGGWDDLREFQNSVRALRAERLRQGLTCEEIARRGSLSVADIEALEAEREFNPRLSLLSRYARALGHRLALTLALGAPAGATGSMIQSAPIINPQQAEA